MKSKQNESGLSLIEVSIIMIIAGLIMSSFFQIKKIVDTNEKENKYHFAVLDAGKKLEEYALSNGRYPLPASFTVGVATANFGVPTAPLNLPSYGGGQCAAGQPAVNGVFCRESNRDIDGDGLPGNSIEDSIFIGALPTSVLGINSEEAGDVFQSRYTYAVSASLTDAVLAVGPLPPRENYNDANGVIEVLSQETGTNALDKENGAGEGNNHYVVISHGFNQSGSYLINGGVNPCPAGLHFWERENCDFDDATFYALTAPGNPLNPAATINGARLNGSYEGTTYFDDAVYYDNQIKGRFWTAKSFSQINMTAGGAAGDARMILGDSTYTDGDFNQQNEDDQRPQVWVNGHARADNFYTKRICDDLQDNCFKITDLTELGALNDDVGVPKSTKCGNNALEAVVKRNHSTGDRVKQGETGEADGSCRFDTRLSNTGELGATGTICPNGANGIDAFGRLICI